MGGERTLNDLSINSDLVNSWFLTFLYLDLLVRRPSCLELVFSSFVGNRSDTSEGDRRSDWHVRIKLHWSTRTSNS